MTTFPLPFFSFPPPERPCPRLFPFCSFDRSVPDWPEHPPLSGVAEAPFLLFFPFHQEGKNRKVLPSLCPAVADLSHRLARRKVLFFLLPFILQLRVEFLLRCNLHLLPVKVLSFDLLAVFFSLPFPFSGGFLGTRWSVFFPPPSLRQK